MPPYLLHFVKMAKTCSVFNTEVPHFCLADCINFFSFFFFFYWKYFTIWWGTENVDDALEARNRSVFSWTQRCSLLSAQLLHITAAWLQLSSSAHPAVKLQHLPGSSCGEDCPPLCPPPELLISSQTEQQHVANRCCLPPLLSTPG